MLLSEIVLPASEKIQLIAVVSQLKRAINLGTEKKDWTLDEFLEYLKKNNVIIDKTDLFDLIKVPPLSNIIKNVSTDKVDFNTDFSSTQSSTEDPEDVVSDMAHRAAKKVD